MNDPFFENYGLWTVFFGWLISISIALLYRQSLPIDETRYLSVAWEMWMRSDFLVPHINGEPYAHKPPLLFWIINASWFIFGVSEWSARLAIALIGLISLSLAYPLARLLWPSEKKMAVLAAWILLTILVWNVWSGMLMFDLLLAACAEIGWIGILLAWRKALFSGWLITGIAIGLGILAKGPVILILVLPVALLAPWWSRGSHQDANSRSWFFWYSGIFMAILVGAVIALAWALPAAAAGGKAYHDAILWGQTANRVVKSFAHSRSWWWYLPLLPLLLSPWSFWVPLWKNCRDVFQRGIDSGAKFSLSIFIGGLILFSLISGKQIHYLIPLFPAFALFAAYVLVKSNGDINLSRFQAVILTLLPGIVGLYILFTPFIDPSPKLPHSLTSPALLWSIPFFGIVLVALIKPNLFARPSGVGILSLSILVFCYGAFFHQMAQDYNLKPIATKIAELQALGKVVGFTGREYKAEFNFYGRLRQPIEVIPGWQDPQQWLQSNKDAAIVKIVKQKPPHGGLYVPVWNKGDYYLWIPPKETNSLG